MHETWNLQLQKLQLTTFTLTLHHSSDYPIIDRSQFNTLDIDCIPFIVLHNIIINTASKMKVLCLFTTSALLSLVGITSAADDYVYGKDPKMDAEYDISLGMAGIQQAAKDPKLLAQLFQDMQVSVSDVGRWHTGMHRHSVRNVYH